MFDPELDLETTCNICYAEFLDAEDLVVHVNQMHADEPRNSIVKCQFCDRQFTNIEACSYHLRDQHLCSLRCCKYCNRVFDNSDDYRKHERKHYAYINKTQYSCSNCKTLFTNVPELEHHEFNYHKNSQSGVFLNDSFPILSSIINIKALHFLQSIGNNVTYMCVVCDHKTSDVNNYIDHLREQDCRSLACDMCSSVYKNKTGLYRHLATSKECNHGLTDKLKKCPECEKMFPSKTWTHHIKKCKAMKCKLCDIVFESMSELSKHQSDAHPAIVKLEMCKYCCRDFAGRTILNKHIQRSHSHEIHLYKYVCVYCHILFKHPQKLFAHFFTCHKDLEPYKCKICKKKFRVRKQFTIHIKLDHKSIGFVEFDSNYNVFFSEKKSEKPFIPVAEGDPTNSLKEPGTIESIIKKVQFNVEDKGTSGLSIENLNSDFLSATETEGEINKTGLQSKDKKKSIIRKKFKKQVVVLDSSSDEDETLSTVKLKLKLRRKIRPRHATWNRKKMRGLDDRKKRFVCPICKKYCYTFQNYNNHISLHYKKVTKCIKCLKQFSSNKELNEHCSKEHSSSKLTETLKNLLEKRKNLVATVDELSNSDRFLRTIKKVPIPVVDFSATLTPVKNTGLSVRKFIENFTPESDAPNKEIFTECNVSIKQVKASFKEPLIKLTKCNLEHANIESSKLAMPTKFHQPVEELPLATLKIVAPSKENLQENVNYYSSANMDSDYYQDDTPIPEVAQEVMLGGSEEQRPVYVPHKVVIPKLPAGCKNIHIAHLQTEAPFYKIVKVEDMLKIQNTVTEPEPKKNIQLPDGTKLVSVNPLAHLLGNKSIDKILDTNNKYCQQKPKDFETAIAKALLKFNKSENCPPKKRKKASVGQE